MLEVKPIGQCGKWQ